jgi:hypothetical protein
MIFIFSFSILFNALISFFGYGESPDNLFFPQEKTRPFVSGKVIDERNFPVPYAKVFINGAEIQTDVMGRFTVMNVEFPYDVIVAERNTSTAVMYRGLSVTDPDLVLFGEPDNRNYNSASIKVMFPPNADTSECFVSFASREMIYCETKTAGSGKDYVFLTVDFPASMTNIRGDVIMMRKNPTGYELFRRKSVSISRNTTRNEVVLPAKPESRTSVKPSKIYSSLKDYYQSKIEVSLDLTDYSKNSQLTIYEADGKKQMTIADLPAKLPASTRLKINGFAETRSGSKFVSHYYSSPGQNFKITDEFLPELVVPSDGYIGVDGRTEFRYTVGSGAGVYVLEFRSRDPEMKYFVVTNETAGRLSLLSRPEFSNTRNLVFSWRVRKYLTYFSVDEFVRPNVFKNDLGYKGVLYSTGRSFRTGYF